MQQNQIDFFLLIIFLLHRNGDFIYTHTQTYDTIIMKLIALKRNLTCFRKCLYIQLRVCVDLITNVTMRRRTIMSLVKMSNIQFSLLQYIKIKMNCQYSLFSITFSSSFSMFSIVLQNNTEIF